VIVWVFIMPTISVLSSVNKMMLTSLNYLKQLFQLVELLHGS